MYVGGTQGPSIGTDARIFDAALPDGPGKEVPHGTPGELVATIPFPNIPCRFWNDKEPVATPGSKYHSAYFNRFDRVWAHGDFCSSKLDPGKPVPDLLGHVLGNEMVCYRKQQCCFSC